MEGGVGVMNRLFAKLHWPGTGFLRRGTALILAMASCVICLPSVHAIGNKKVIRVGYPIQPGFTEIDRNGNYSGYTYDYLQELAQYAGWEYEFVRISGDINDAISKTMEMLENGELDLMGGTVYLSLIHI